MKTFRSTLPGRAVFASGLALWLGCCGAAIGGNIDPVLKASWPGFPRGPVAAAAVSGNYAYVAAGGLQVIDISNPANPQRVGGNSLFRDVQCVVLSKGEVFLAAGAEGLATLEMRPFVKSISRDGENIKLSWEGFGPARLQRATRLASPDWQDLWKPVLGTARALRLEYAGAMRD